MSADLKAHLSPASPLLTPEVILEMQELLTEFVASYYGDTYGVWDELDALAFNARRLIRKAKGRIPRA